MSETSNNTGIDEVTFMQSVAYTFGIHWPVGSWECIATYIRGRIYPYFDFESWKSSIIEMFGNVFGSEADIR
jgi:hypothetical protein